MQVWIGKSQYFVKVTVFFMLFFTFIGNNTDVLTIETEKENRFVLEQLWSLGFIHHTVWLGLRLNNGSKDPSDAGPWDIGSGLRSTTS